MNQVQVKDSSKVSGNQSGTYVIPKIDLENWMGQLPEYLTQQPLVYLSIPGSHNSFSYSITTRDGVSPDSPPFVQYLGKWFRPLSRQFIFNWSRGQKIDVVKQLNAGIRYFDVRLVLKQNVAVIAHGLYGRPIQEFLEEIDTFLGSHPKEVVILDFQHFYEFAPYHHEKMLAILVHIFKNKICRRVRKMRENTLQLLWSNGLQVLIIYRHQVPTFNDIFWPSPTWPTPWPNKIKVSELLPFLNESLLNRKEGMGHVTQGILTPTTQYVATHAFGSLRNLALSSNKKIIPWMESKSNGANGINVIICDFVEKYNFSEKVILLNYKAYREYANQSTADETLVEKFKE